MLSEDEVMLLLLIAKTWHFVIVTDIKTFDFFKSVGYQQILCFC